MTFDSNQELWLADNSSSADLIIMDTQTGGWQYQYGTSAGNNTDFGRAINDLTTFRVFTENAVEIDKNFKTSVDGIYAIGDVDNFTPIFMRGEGGGTFSISVLLSGIALSNFSYS